MTEYKLPDPEGVITYPGTPYDRDAYTADQLREEVAKAEQRGRESMRDECVRVCERLSERWPDEGGDARGCLHEIKEIK